MYPATRHYIQSVAALIDKIKERYDPTGKTQENERLKENLAGARVDREAWSWVGNGEDDLDSMGNAMLVTITAGDLRSLIEKVRQEQHEADAAHYETTFRLAVLSWSTGVGRNLRKLAEGCDRLEEACQTSPPTRHRREKTTRCAVTDTPLYSDLTEADCCEALARMMGWVYDPEGGAAAEPNVSCYSTWRKGKRWSDCPDPFEDDGDFGELMRWRCNDAHGVGEVDDVLDVACGIVACSRSGKMPTWDDYKVAVCEAIGRLGGLWR